MDEQTVTQIEQAIEGRLASSGWILLLITVIGAGVGAFLGSYFEKKGELRAIREDFDEILRQTHAQTQTTEDVKLAVSKELVDFTKRLERRSEFEQYLLLERYKLVSEFSYRLGRIRTDLNRTWAGQEIEGLFKDNEIVPLSGIFEDLSAQSFQLSDKFYNFFWNQAGIILELARATDDETRERSIQQYEENLKQLAKMVKEEFGSERVSW